MLYCSIKTATGGQYVGINRSDTFGKEANGVCVALSGDSVIRRSADRES